MTTPTPAASRAAPALPTPWKTVTDATGEPVQVYRAFQMRDYARAALEAAQPASPAPLTDERAAFEAWYVARHGADYSPHKNEVWDNASRADDEEVWLARAALASPQVAPARELDLAYQEACNLATWLFKKHYAKDYAGLDLTWELCDSTRGVLSQISNMVCGLAAPVQVAPQTQKKSLAVQLDEVIEDAQQAAFEDWLEGARPSGDADQVQREWEFSGEREDFEDELREAIARLAPKVAPQDDARDAAEALTDEQILSAWKHVSVWGWATDEDRIARAKELLALSTLPTQGDAK